MDDVPKRKRSSPRWRKLIVDSKLISVYPLSRESAKERRMSQLKGVTLVEASREERKAFLARHPTSR